MPNQALKPSIVFVSFEGQFEEFGEVGKHLRAAGVGSVLWTYAKRDYRAALKLGVFDEVVDLLEGFDRRRRSTVEEHAETLRRLRNIERSVGDNSFHLDAAMDRVLTGASDAEIDLRSIRDRWTHQQVAEVSLTLWNAIEAQIQRGYVLLAIGETNSLALRIAYRCLAKHGIAHCYPAVMAHLGGGMYFEDTLDFSWERCRELYREFLARGIPSAYQSFAEGTLKAIKEQRAKPSYFVAARRGPRGWTDRLRPRQVLQGVQSWRVALDPVEQSSPRTVSPEVVSPIARFKRSLAVKARRKYYETVASRELPESPYGCYFLHVQPEYSTEGLAFEHQDQVATIRNIVASLPADMVLVVKDHKTEGGRRSRDYYAEIISIPNVCLVHDTLDSLRIIEKSKMSFTLSGTVALESMCLGVPCVLLGNIYYEEFKGVYKAQNFTHLRELLRKAEELLPASREQALAALAARYAASYRARYPGSPGDEGNIKKLTEAVLHELRIRKLVPDSIAARETSMRRV